MCNRVAISNWPDSDSFDSSAIAVSNSVTQTIFVRVMVANYRLFNCRTFFFFFLHEKMKPTRLLTFESCSTSWLGCICTTVHFTSFLPMTGHGMVAGGSLSLCSSATVFSWSVTSLAPCETSHHT